MPRELRHPRRYRLIAEPPFTVAFPSVTYRVDFRPVEGCPQAELAADAGPAGPCWSLHRTHHKVLRRDVFELGFELTHPTAASLIVEKLCAMRCAELLG